MKQTYGALKQDCRGVNNKNHAAERWDLEFVFQTPKKVFSNTTKKLFIKNHIIGFPSVQPGNWVGFRISLSLSRQSAIFRDKIENYFSCSRLARRDRDYHMTILVFRDENEIPFCYSHVSRRDRDFRKSFLVVEREKMKLTLVENSRDREFSLTSVSHWSALDNYRSSPLFATRPPPESPLHVSGTRLER